MNKLESLINNFFNGNLTDAKKQAKGFSAAKIREGLMDCGKNSEQASLTAIYLKGGMEWQEYCDQEFALRSK